MKLIDYNYDILGKLPKEIFTCHDIFVNKMLNDFNDISIAMQKSVFVSDSLRPHESQHARPPCPSPTPGVHPDSDPSSQ